MRTSIIGAVILLACPSLLPAQPPTQPVLNWAQGLVQSVSPFPPGGFAILRGSGFTAVESQALAAPYPKKLAGVSVAANGLACPMVSVSPTRAVILLPYSLAAAESTELTLILSNDSGSTEPLITTWGLRPTFLTADREEFGPATVLDESLAPLSSVTPGQTVILPILGLGTTDPPVPDGAAAPFTDPLPAVVHAIRVYFGDAEAQVLSTTLAPGQVGVYYAKVVVPEGGDGSVAVMTDNRELHRVNLPVPPAPPNAMNVTGTVESLFGTGPIAVATWSPILVPGKFRVSLTVPPQALPFNVELKGPAGGVSINLNTPSRTWFAKATVPTLPTRFGDFTGSGLATLDFVSGVPFPGNIIPVMRIPPQYVAAFQSLPSPSTPSLSGAVAEAMTTGEIPADGNLTLEFATGGWIAIGVASRERSAGFYPAVFTLFVDGLEVGRTTFRIPILQ